MLLLLLLLHLDPILNWLRSVYILLLILRFLLLIIIECKHFGWFFIIIIIPFFIYLLFTLFILISDYLLLIRHLIEVWSVLLLTHVLCVPKPFLCRLLLSTQCCWPIWPLRSVSWVSYWISIFQSMQLSRVLYTNLLTFIQYLYFALSLCYYSRSFVVTNQTIAHSYLLLSLLLLA
jgi:hypothetical protein